MKIFVFVALFSCILSASNFKTFVMDDNYFRCLVPSDWKIERDVEKDKKSGIYKIVLINPLNSKNTITIKYYSLQSGQRVEDFIEKNSKTSEGELEGSDEKYEKVKNIVISSKTAFEINRKYKEFESLDAPSASYWLKERIIVIPAKKGFYTLTYSCDEKNFAKYYRFFKSILVSFKTLY